MEGADKMLLNTGFGLTISDTVSELEQPSATKICIYFTKTGLLDVLTSNSLMLPIPLDAGLLIPLTVSLLHANAVPVVGLKGE